MVEGSIPRAINHTPMDSKCSLKKCDLVNCKNISFALGKAAVADEQQDKAPATAGKLIFPKDQAGSRMELSWEVGIH